MCKHSPQPNSLTMQLLVDMPLRLRIMPCVYNRKCKAIFEQVLLQRNDEIVSAKWREGSKVEEPLRTAISDLIVKHLYWSKPLFIPQDECFVLFRCWQRGIGDCMEREHFLMDLESLLNLDIPDDLRLSSMTYREFLEVLAALAGG